MSDRITGTHLRSENLNDNIKEKLKTFGEWAAEKGNFESVTNEIYKCGDKNGGKKLEPVLKALEYKHIEFQIYRVVARAYVSSGDAPAYEPAYLIPVRITGPGTIWDTETAAMQLRVGQRVYFDKPIIVEGGMYFVIITDRRSVGGPQK